MSNLKNLLNQNAKWAYKLNRQSPKLFTDLAKGQSPHTLWLGCSDSRVPPEQLTDSNLGSIFTHRNIANVVGNQDISFLSVLEYAVVHLKVKQIIVCGHYQCGGIKAALDKQHSGLIDNWLFTVKSTLKNHSKELNVISDQNKRFNRAVELHTLAQLENLARTTIVQTAWVRKQELELHACVFDIASGRLKYLDKSYQSNEDLD